MSRRRLVIAFGLGFAAAALLVVVGRLEAAHEHRQMLHGIEAVRRAVGPSVSRPGPTDYVLSPGESCLLYAAAGRSYGLELCIDPYGRVVEAMDRRGTTLRVYSIVTEPDLASLRIPPAFVASEINRLHARWERLQALARRSSSSGAPSAQP